MWDPTPWFVGGGAQHSPEVARLLAYAATSGAEGIVTPDDLKVVPLDVPGGAVRAVPGAALVLNRSAGGAQQTYVARLPEADQIEVAATGSGGGRSDLIVAQIEDPFLPGEPWQEPADPTVGPYVFTRVIPNVPAGTTRLQDVPGYEGRSAVNLARIDLPPSTGTVAAAMITDLRKVALPRTKRAVFNREIVTRTNVTSAAFTDWPDAGASVDVPDWATAAIFRVETLAGHIGPNVTGEVRIMFGGLGVVRQAYNLDLPAGQEVRVPMVVAGQADITHARGETRLITMQARRTAGTGYITSREDAYYVLEVEFMEQAV